ncbi:oxidoreductase [Pontibacter ruber]|uniref:Oxidoreductase n=1 Tax=Pontibacter ruber TaxID=1343895 RepID=A0ABW5D2J4_9BACT|nr:oxidoreductase [Pontibacter ruber]
MATEKVWFITGVSGGFGRELAAQAAKAGAKVIGTVRQAGQLEEFNAISPGNTFGYLLDVTNPDGVKATVDAAFKYFGRLDVLVNNAGFGFLGAIEEASIAEVRQVMETNFFGALQVTQAVLPYMRQQGSGRIIQISSVAGIRSTPGFGVYNASKFALEGFSEALAQEVAPFNIQVTIVEPGPFRTRFAGTSIKRASRHMQEYESTSGRFKQAMEERNGYQDGDPEKGAAVIVQVASSDNPPLRLPLGRTAFEAVRLKLQQVAKDLDAWEYLAAHTSFDE